MPDGDGRVGLPARGRRFGAGLMAACVAAAATGCAARFTPPVGPGQPMPAPEARLIWDEASAGCADLTGWNGEVRPSGRVAGTAIRGLELLVAVEQPGRIGLEAVAGGQTVFTLRGAAAEATLWLPRERRVVVAPANRILAALVGLDVEPERLLALFGGCIAPDRTATRVERLGELVRVTTSDSVVYLGYRDGRWQARGGTFGPFVADYRAWTDGWPASVGIRSTAGYEPALDVQLTVAFRRLNPDLPDAAFTVQVLPDAVPAAVEDLRPFWNDDQD